MENAKWRGVAKGLALSAVYCLAYLAAWFSSLDQWFLPAGLRVAGLLLLPYRYWPYLFAGDIAALLLLRVPRAGYDGELWAYASPFLLPPLIATVPALLRNRLKTIEQKIKWLPLMAPSIALWGWFSNMLINFVLSGPTSFASFDKLMKFSVGSWLGIFIVLLPWLVWLERDSGKISVHHFRRDLLISIITSSALYFSISFSGSLDPSLRQGMLMLMIAPAIGLAFRHGWHGAAIGIFVANLAIAMTLPDFNFEAAHDTSTFMVQQALVIAATGLLVLGATISEQYAKARGLGIAEAEAIKAARAIFLSSERILRDKAISMDEMQLRVDTHHRQLAKRLKANGDHKTALLVNTEAVEHAARFQAQVADVYPIKIETHGLNAVLNSQGFVDNRGGGANVLPLLGSDPKLLTLELQLAAYRCACHALDLLSETEPSAYVLKTRIRHIGRRRGIALFVTAKPTTLPQSTHKSATAALELAARIKAHGGIVKRHHAHRVSMWLSEPIVSAKIVH
jgi:glucose-6-phosphate-specific signal transduction histidine kinase